MKDLDLLYSALIQFGDADLVGTLDGEIKSLTISIYKDFTQVDVRFLGKTEFLEFDRVRDAVDYIFHTFEDVKVLNVEKMA